uniref:Uncharacterized protein n=1 Tax=Populus davidiana TaxID=266767 RepID=A0A6M2EAE9_9ROSI
MSKLTPNRILNLCRRLSRSRDTTQLIFLDDCRREKASSGILYFSRVSMLFDNNSALSFSSCTINSDKENKNELEQKANAITHLQLLQLSFLGFTICGFLFFLTTSCSCTTKI